MLWFLLVFSFLFPKDPPDKAIQFMLKNVNELRANGCQCNRDWMPPVGPVKWNSTLFKSAYSHAKEMDRYKFFKHFSRKGENIGQRVESFGYDWLVVGENIGMGQDYFLEVLEEWIESESHCKMLMNPNVDEMAVARKGIYWVQHFGKLKDPRLKYRRRN